MALFRSRWPSTTTGRTWCSRRSPTATRSPGASGHRAMAVDPTRTAVPVSATLIRERPLEHLDFLAPPVRAWVEAQARGAERR